ncbi:MAG: DEAD/DEAH box helicase [Deltaproteobacteria bacterium]|nr:DEAD/DEAH box helicase [Deltaproteobacteria bacterium]
MPDSNQPRGSESDPALSSPASSPAKPNPGPPREASPEGAPDSAGAAEGADSPEAERGDPAAPAEKPRKLSKGAKWRQRRAASRQKRAAASAAARRERRAAETPEEREKRYLQKRAATERSLSADQAGEIVVTAKVQEFLSEIGQPQLAPFIPDPFQTESIELIKSHDVIVSAPTGSGKTWIAQKAIEEEIAAGRSIWYASPLKALSNAKFIEFGKIFGTDLVGLITGDHKLNPRSPIIVGTTEILRNQLYDAMSSARDLDYDLVILDEAHYLADLERGVVWEEVLIYLPTRVRLLLLSATIENAREIADWLSNIRGTEVKVVNGGERPVPLIPLCFRRRTLSTLEDAAGKSAVPDKEGRRRSSFGSRRDLPFSSGSLKCLRDLDLLPAICFLKSRSDCDKAARLIDLGVSEPPERALARASLIDEYVAKYPYIESYQDLTPARKRAVASHHAGHLPQYKFLVEELMSQGLLSAIFATSTVSAGVNFPARTVVIPQSDRFNGSGFADLTATELAQMTGRAGRRGRDLIGFALILPGPFMDLKLMDGLFRSPPNPIRSRLNIDFSMVLNLLKAYPLSHVKDILVKSLLVWQNARKKSAANLRMAGREIIASFQKHARFLKKSGYLTAAHALTPKGEVASQLRLDHPLVYSEAIAAQSLPDSPALLAATVAYIIDSSLKGGGQSPYAQKPPQKLIEALLNFEKATTSMASALAKDDFSTPSYEPNRSWAIYEWALEGDFHSASRRLGRDIGDMVRTVLMTVEYLNQFRSLSQEYPDLSQAAQMAQSMLLRPPIV